MSRVFPLLPNNTLKIIDTIDLFSNVSEKVFKFGVTNSLSLPREEEELRLRKADLILAIQNEEHSEIIKMAPDKKVITVGMDFEAFNTEDVATQSVLIVASDNPRNIQGVNGFIKYAWPLIRQHVKEAELIIVGKIGATIIQHHSTNGIKVIGQADSLFDYYNQAKVVINPVCAGTGIKIKSIESFCYFKPLVTWPAGAEGLDTQIIDFCIIADNWYTFTNKVIEVLLNPKPQWFSAAQKEAIKRTFSPEYIYSDLKRELSRVLCNKN